MAANHSQSVNFNAEIMQIVSVLRSPSFCTELNLEMKSENPSPPGVWFRFHHGMSFTSYGEKITITLTPFAPNATRVDVLSECGMPTQIIDWGKNRQNVCNIIECLQRNVPQGSNPAMAAAPTAYAPAAPTQPSTAPETKFCVNCGKQINKAAKFCPFCGSQLP